MNKLFTARGIEALKPQKVAKDHMDGGNKGFGLRVELSGRKTWFLFYWVDGFGNSGEPKRLKKRHKIGTFPEMSLEEARATYAIMKSDLRKGIVPGQVEREESIKQKNAATVSGLIEEYLLVVEGKKKVLEQALKVSSKNKKIVKKKRFGIRKSAPEIRRTLKKEVEPLWGSKKVKDISRDDVQDLIDGIGERGAPVQANRTLSTISMLFSYGVSKIKDLSINPCIDVDKYVEEAREKTLTKAEIKKFWNGLEECKMTKCVQIALKLQLVTCQRKGEVVGSLWDEVDMDERIWTIPAEKSKNGVEQRVPLSNLAIDLIEEARKLGKSTNLRSQWLFPSPLFAAKDVAILPSSVNHALRDNLEMLGLTDIVPHDLRRTGSTFMVSLGISEETVDKVLNHKEKGLRKVYVRYGFDKEKKYALDIWAAHLEEIITDEKKQDNVVSLK